MTERIEEIYEIAQSMTADSKLMFKNFGDCDVDLVVHKDEGYIKQGETYGEYAMRMFDEYDYDRDDIPDRAAFYNGVTVLMNNVDVTVLKNGIEIGSTGSIGINSLPVILSDIETGDAKVYGSVMPLIDAIHGKGTPLKEVTDTMSKENKKKSHADVER